MYHRAIAGFTLIELSIVLLIIGLLAGGILFGRDLIQAAEMRAQISQIEQYNTAVNTFRNKYNYPPGDLSASQAASLGFGSRNGAYAQGDGNGFINGATDQTYGWPTVGGETLLFWDDLASAGLIDFDIQGLFPVLGGVTTPPSGVSLFLPPAKIGQGFVTIYGNGEPANRLWRENNYQLVEFQSPSSGLIDGVVSLVGGPLTPMQAFAMDQKIDDALPTSGAISAMATGSISPVLALNYSIQYMASFGPPLPPSMTMCVSYGAPIVYNTAAPDQANRNSCSLRFRARF